MGTPRNFELDPISPSLRPQPSPPRYLKRQIYSDPKVFKVIDKHAVDEARTNYRTFRDLIWNLICKKEFTQLEKCRAIFRWMTTKNMYTIMFDSELPGSPEQILGGFKDGRVTYARIFECLCQYAGLHCVTISGWAKGVDYRPGHPITQTPINHSWNAVYIDQNWQLVDSHWATRYLQNERNTPENLVYEYDDFYFLPEPGHLIYSHCPEEPSWQLLVPAVARTEYEEYPLVKSFFFSVGMEFLQQNMGVIYTKNGLYTITLSFQKPAAFTFKLAFGEKMSEAIQGINLKRYIIQETTSNRVTFYFRAPREGNYFLTLFAQTVGERLKVENIFKAACEYKIVVDQAAGDIRPYPLCNDSNWGPGAPVRQYGLAPSHTTAILSAPNGRAELSFTKSRDVRLYARLVRDGFTEEQLEQYVDVREQDNQIFVSCSLPNRGEYGLEVYANEPEREGDTFTHMCQYLVSYIDRDLGQQYGQVYDRLDLGYSMQAQPELWQSSGGHFGSLPRGPDQRGPPGKQQYDNRYGVGPQAGGPGGQYPDQGGQYANQAPGAYMAKPGEPGTIERSQVGGMPYGATPEQVGSYSSLPRGGGTGVVGYGAAQGQMAPPESIGHAPGAVPDQKGNYGSLPRGGSGGAGVVGYGAAQGQVAPPESIGHAPGAVPDQPGTWRPDQKNRVGLAYGAAPASGGQLGKQVYESSSAEWDEGSYRQQKIRQETEASEDGQHSFRQETTQMSSRMETVTIGGKKQPPPVARKPVGAKPGSGPGYGADDLPPPPPELMDQTYNQQPGRTAEKPPQAPVEIVYVTSDSKGSPHTGRKTQEDVNRNQKPIEVVYTGGDSPKSLRKKTASPKTLPKPGIRRGDPRYDVIAGSRTPSGDPQGVPASQWTNTEDGGDDLPPPLPTSGPPEDSQWSRTSGAPGAPRDGQRVPGAPQPGFESSYNYPLGAGPKGTHQSSVYVSPRPAEPEQEYEPHDQKLYTSTLTVQPPQSFRPVPIQRQEAAPKPQPPSVPPKPFKDTEVFQSVDTHAVEVSKMEHKSFRDLVWVLIYARDITNELEKARAIFLWLCSQDLAKLHFDSVDKDSPEEILISLKQGQTTYAVVYETLCSYAGLHCKTLTGFAKGAEYKPGMKFVGEQGQHSWNAVLVDGAWRLVDCHWAARRLVGKKVTVENIRYELDEYYFMPDPHQLIFTHFPDESNWQLLERAISLQDFENLVPVKSAFFKYGLQILSHKEAVIHSGTEVTIRIGCPPDKTSSLAFTFGLAYNDSGAEEFQGMKLNRFGMQEMVDNVAFFTIRPPERGSYRLIIYAKDMSTDKKEGVYGGVCEYEVACNQVTSPQPFPPCVHTSWGPGDSAHKYQLIPQQKGAIFSTVQGQAELRFAMTRTLRFTAKLKTNKEDEKALAGYLMHRVVGDQAIFTLNAPHGGEYGLEIYANDPDVDGNALYHAYQYLIICTETSGPVEPLPVLQPGYLGPQPMFNQVGLTLSSHPDPYIQLEGDELEVVFTTSQPLRMTSQLLYVSKGKQEELSKFILQQARGQQVILQVRLPKPGLYKLQVYGLPYSDTSEGLPGVYNYLLNCHSSGARSLHPFPTQYGQWNEGCFLYAPQDGSITPGPTKLMVRVGVPKANSVAVVIGDDWTQLDQKAGETGPWEGEVPLAQHRGKETKMAICANYGAVRGNYSTLLEYSI